MTNVSTHNAYVDFWLKIALFGALLTPACHVVVLFVNGFDPIKSQVIQLSRHQLAIVHTAGLASFGLAHLALSLALGGLDRGKLWPMARALLAASGFGLIYTAWFFAAVSDIELASGASDPLWVVASLTGVAMGALQPGLSRVAPRLGLFSAICLGIWLWLIPVAYFVNDQWIGAYERIVGCVYVTWVTGVSAALIKAKRQETI
ncbi:MAG: hypothetical protein AAF290_15235 [Pseudomonadota bacterium]